MKSTVEVQPSLEAVLGARIEQLEAALAEALDIAEWESSEYRGKRSHPARLLQLRQVLIAKGHGAVSRPNVTDEVVTGLAFARACVLDQQAASHAHCWGA